MTALLKAPSLKHKLSESLEKAYRYALISAEKETNINRKVFPSVCPWSFEQITNSEFYPD